MDPNSQGMVQQDNVEMRDLFMRNQMQTEQRQFQMPYNQENVEFQREIINIDHGFPDELRTKIWGWRNKVNSTANISAKDKKLLYNSAKITEARLAFCTPRREKSRYYRVNARMASDIHYMDMTRSQDALLIKQQNTQRNIGEYRYHQPNQKKDIMQKVFG